ncbi:MAG TPA: hypothetical protein QGF43_01695 [Acidimicrobiales bacterium]|mgnify:FL=1|nr:hypothetical protein [Actinomycetota bacterium]MDP6176609.1 hypothetical protein [Acidimicrobiales bacterium]MDP6280878.1 hypothetical protein [Acidimicrobiales bacterium]MDP7117469.1 hypothetical protein [Acidimicrobiales bacterium]MDP7410522.1 hypothetical protein [Acidimicrobiales bacterium]
MKKGRHRRFEEARALKRNQDLDLDSIFDSLDNTREGSSKSGESTAFDAWADDFDDEESTDSEGETASDQA